MSYLMNGENDATIVEFIELWEELNNLKQYDFRNTEYRHTMAGSFNITSTIMDMLVTLLQRADDFLIENPTKDEDRIFNIYVNEFKIECIRETNSILGTIGNPRITKIYNGVRKYNLNNIFIENDFNRVIQQERFKPFREQHEYTTSPTKPYTSKTALMLSEKVKLLKQKEYHSTKL